MDRNEKYVGITNEELFRIYKKTGNISIKHELVLRYLHIVRSIAIQMRGVYNDFTQLDDIVNEGVLAIIGAIDKFDIEKNIKFESYISKRMRGLVIDIARKNDWVSRNTRKNAKDIDKAANTLFTNLGRMPTHEEIADYLNVPIEKYQENLGKSNVMNVLSFEMLLQETIEGRMSGQVLNSDTDTMPEVCLDRTEMEQEIKKALGKLREREQLVVSLHYVQELSMKEIAVVLGVSEPRISQIHSNALRKLRVYMQQENSLC
ncbi:MAG TPA: FliA/WhiG family RNA polymerase sigma factor [Lachnospiraceae bacterium]|nr:FliA/WhiG family RNA polymerase sigma factor [Lachnospiraceae bacterium]